MSRSEKILRVSCLLLLSLVMLPKVVLASVADGYLGPTIAVPYCAVPPIIDGVVDDAEWQGAVSLNALQTVRAAVSSRQTRFWLAWDAENLYLAMRSPLRPGERVVQAYRDPNGDPAVVFDDSYEIWLDAGAKTPGGLECFIQYLGNFAGAKYDNLRLPTVGLSQMSYEAGWQPKNTIRTTPEGTAWEMEVAIPRKSLYLPVPFRDGATVMALIARDYKRPWEQQSLSGINAFTVREHYARLLLTKDAPALHLLAVADPAAKTLGLRLDAAGARMQALTWHFTSDGHQPAEGKFTIEPGKRQTVADTLKLDTPGTGAYRVTITSEDGKTVYLDWCAQRAFGDLKPLAQTFQDTNDVQMRIVLNPIKDYVRVTGDFINYDDRTRFDHGEAVVLDANGKQLAAATLRLDARAYMRAVLQLGTLAPGNYSARITCVDKEGHTLLEREQAFTKKDAAKEFPWWNTSRGNMEKVLAPWTPVTYDGKSLGMWGRALQIGQAGLPAQVTSQQIPLLAGASRMVLEGTDGTVTEATAPALRTISQADFRTVVEARSKLGTLGVTSRITAEYDGMYKVEMTLAPEKATPVRTLKIVVPFTNATAEYLHAHGEGIRYGYACQFLPQGKTGRLWDSREIDGQRMAVGSFIPYLWIGNPHGGLCWFADTDAGWVPNNDAPAIEIRRDAPGSCDLVFNLISAPFTIDAPRTITFAFEATPVKPLFRGWRADTWNCSDTFANFQCVDKIGLDRMDAPLPWTLDVEKCKQMVEARHATRDASAWGLCKYPQNAVPYSRHNELFPRFMPEASYFTEQWQSLGSWHIYYDKSLTDYFVYQYSEWARQCGLDGIYSDNVRPEPCFNVEAGRGYYLPDGRVQPAYNIFGVREYFLRLRAAFQELGKQNKMVIHMTHAMIIPWIGAADIAYDGEDHVIPAAGNSDFIDAWPLERMRLDIARQWGVMISFMCTGDLAHMDPRRRRAVGRSFQGRVILHDALPRDGAPYDVFLGRDRFGIEADDVEFIGYWEKDRSITCDTPGVLVSAWKRPGKLLLAVLNENAPGKAVDAVIHLDAVKLGLTPPAEWKVSDAEKLAVYTYFDPKAGDQPVQVWEGQAKALGLTRDGAITVPINRHDYRQIIIERVDREAVVH